MILACSGNRERAGEVEGCNGVQKWAGLAPGVTPCGQGTGLVLIAMQSHQGQGSNRRETYCALHKEVNWAAVPLPPTGSYLKKVLIKTRACAKMFFAVLFITVSKRGNNTMPIG